MLVSELTARLRSRLSGKFPLSESREMVNIILENLMGWNTTDVLLKADYDLTDITVSKAESVVDRLLNNEPIQYIFGSAHFYGMKFLVNPSTLIPRQETAQLVDLIVKEWDNRSDLTVLDLGTGSGCIAIALARNLPFSSVTGIDISERAIETARENNLLLKTNVTFATGDILNMPATDDKYDIIVSNPPYIAQSESAQMEPNVLDFEPHTALFVPDSNPLLFYKAIAAYALTALKSHGKLYLEINPLFANELRSYLLSNGWGNVALERDMQKHYRFIIASR